MMRKRSVYAGFIACMCMTGTLRAQSKPVSMDMEDLARSVEAVRSQVSDLTVSFRFDAVWAPANHAAARSHRTATVKGSKILLDHEYGPMPEYRLGSFRRTVGFNGERTSIYEVNARRASIISLREREAQTKGVGFFHLMLWNPTAGHVNGHSEMDLLSVLASPHSSLRPQYEDVDGHLCLVVDERNPSNGNITFTVWIDADRGFLPIQQRSTDAASERVYMEIFVDAAEQVEGGVWFPMRGRKITHVVPGLADFSGELEYNLEVDGFAEGNPAIAVNQGIGDEVFNIIPALPPGVRVLDRDSGESWTVAGKDFRRLGESFDAQFASYRERDRDLDAALSGSSLKQQPEDVAGVTSRGVAIGAGASLACLGVGGLAVRGRRYAR